MSKTATLWIVLIIIAAGGAAAYAYSTQRDDSMMKDTDAMKADTNAMMADEKADTMVDEKKMTDTSSSDVMMKTDPAMKGDAMMKDDGMKKEDAMMKTGSYEAYTPEKLALASSGDVVIFFHAPWCPICQALEKEITAKAAGIPAGLTILKVDFDTALELRKKYGVTLQHTFVQVRADGSAIQKWSDSSTLAAVIKKVQ